MKLSAVCVLALATSFAVGLAPGLFAQAEIAEPGLQIVGRGGEDKYTLATGVHALAFAGLAPLCGFALALAILAEIRRSGLAQAGAIIALACAPLLAFGLATASSQRFLFPVPWGSSLTIPDGLMLFEAAAGFIALIFVGLLAPGMLASAIIFAALSGIAILVSWVQHVVLANAGADHALSDTYYILAANHQAGVAIALNIVGALSAWSIRAGGPKRIWFSAVVGSAALLTGTLAALAASRLGLMGMPQRYVDYPPGFAQEQSTFALWSIAFAGVLVAAVVWLAIASWRERRLQTVGPVTD